MMISDVYELLAGMQVRARSSGIFLEELCFLHQMPGRLRLHCLRHRPADEDTRPSSQMGREGVSADTSPSLGSSKAPQLQHTKTAGEGAVTLGSQRSPSSRTASEAASCTSSDNNSISVSLTGNHGEVCFSCAAAPANTGLAGCPLVCAHHQPQCVW